MFRNWPHSWHFPQRISPKQGINRRRWFEKGLELMLTFIWYSFHIVSLETIPLQLHHVFDKGARAWELATSRVMEKDEEIRVNFVRKKAARRTDSRWSFLVLFCASLTQSLCCGTAYSYGVLLPPLIDHFGEGRERTGTFHAIHIVNVSEEATRIRRHVTSTGVSFLMWDHIALIGHARFVHRGWRPGGVLVIFSGGGVPPGPENPYPISDQNIAFSIPHFRPDSQNVYPISATLNGFTAYGTSWRLKRCSHIFSSGSNFRLEMLKNDTLWGGTYLHGLHIGVLPPPPRGGWRLLDTELHLFISRSRGVHSRTPKIFNF